MGTVHGGSFATMLDTAMGCAVHSTLPARKAYTTQELKLSLVPALTDGVPMVRAEGRLVLGFDQASEKIRTKGFDPARASIIGAHQGSRLGAPHNADVATTKIDVVPRNWRRCGPKKPVWPLVQLRPCDDAYLT